MAESYQQRKKIAFVLIAGAALIALCGKPGFASSAGPADEVLAAVENHYRDTRDLTGHVVQKNVFKAVGKAQSFEGTLFIKKPGMLKLEYTNGQVILVHDASALFYSRKNRQVVKKTFTDFEHMNIPVAFLLGAARIRDDFKVLPAEPGSPGSVALLPKKESAAMRKLLLRSDATGRIEQLVIFDRSGNRSEVDFSDIRENTGLADSLFTFTPPKDTEVIE